jgi:hypothetical protein
MCGDDGVCLITHILPEMVIPRLIFCSQAIKIPLGWLVLQVPQVAICCFEVVDSCNDIDIRVAEWSHTPTKNFFGNISNFS